MKKISIFVLVMSLCILSAVFAGGRRPGEMPAPRLLAPDDVATLSDQGMEFRWGSEGGNFDHYDFRLYKGTQTYEKNLILQKDVPAGQTSIVIEPSYFAVGEAYAWSLRYVGTRKSMSSYSIFKIKQ